LTDEPRRDSFYIDGICVSGHPIQLDAEERKKNREKNELAEIACSKEVCGCKERARKERKENKQRVVS
jgi:hypothetical protein